MTEVLADTVLEPHPTLRPYYAEASAKRGFIREIFDTTAGDYDHVERMLALGTGSWYRRRALLRAGLSDGMNVLDVAMGTGLVARAAAEIIGDRKRVVGVDPSIGMLTQAARHSPIRAVMGLGEHLPFASDHFDFLSMGYALRHLSDLKTAFREFFRVLRPGGTICLLEITRPRRGLKLLRWYMKRVIPRLTRHTASHERTALLWEYYWETIERCISPEAVVEALEDAGFVEAKRFVELGIFSEYTARKPPP
ncbi:MAG TPA: class I SAM-dependent methyltransferase [Tepidisphaeraceae bacterium]|nr:class I SAM-dependent methyltransferase [Tepidisphaeraceae bacterium]